MGVTGDFGILLGDALCGVNENQTYVRPFDGHNGPQGADFLQIFVHPGLFANTGSIHQHIFSVLIFHPLIDAVPRGARHVADDDPLFPGDAVEQGGFARVGLADQRHSNQALFLLFPLVLWGEMRIAGVQQIAGVIAVDGGHAHRVPHAQVVEFIKFRRRLSRSVQFVDAQNHRFFGALEQRRHVLIRRGDAGTHVDDKDNHIGGVDGDHGLSPHKFQNLVVGLGLDAPGIDELKDPTSPFPFGINPVPRDAGGILHNGLFPANQPVKEHGFAHIGPAHDCNNWFSHTKTIPPKNLRFFGDPPIGSISDESIVGNPFAGLPASLPSAGPLLCSAFSYCFAPTLGPTGKARRKNRRRPRPQFGPERPVPAPAAPPSRRPERRFPHGAAYNRAAKAVLRSSISL